MDVLFASLPILMVIVAMLAFSLPAKTALPLGRRGDDSARIIRINLIPCFVYCLIVILVLGLLA